MAHCPQCRVEYEEGTARCSDCDVALVAGPPPGRDEIDWVELRMVSRDVEASLIEGFLEAEGIPVSLDNARSHSFPETFGDLSEIRIQVPRERRDEAEAILEKREKEFEATPPDDEAVLTDEGAAHLDADDGGDGDDTEEEA